MANTTNNNKQYPTFIDFRTVPTENGSYVFGAVIGNTTRDIELRYTSTGKPVASTGVAVNLGAKHINYVLGTNYAEDETIFLNVSAWDKNAENLANLNVGKGSRLAITGTLSIEEYQGRQSLRLTVSRFQILNKKDLTNVANSSIESQPIALYEDDLPF